MRVLSASDPRVLQQAIKILKDGGIIVYPTETSYGLGGDWTRASVHRRIMAIKGRPVGKQLSVIVSSLSSAERYVRFNRVARALARKFWPGPLSLVLPLKKSKNTLSLRVSPHPFASRLVRSLGRPLIATSANISGSETLYHAEAVFKEFQDRHARPDLIIDAGNLPRRRPSTVARVHEDGFIEVLRQGPISISKLRTQISKPQLKTR